MPHLYGVGHHRRMAAPHDVEINVMHTLENFRDAYDDEASVVVLEAMANALDARATTVDVILRNQHVSFRDNGPGMNKKQFKTYHKISGSTKTKGRGIGFAGVGAKVYLAIWKNTVIHTETYGDDGPFASDMYVTHGRPKWNECSTATSIMSHGTLYCVKLRENDYTTLVTKIHDIMRDAFNPALLNGLTVSVNAAKLEPWNPPHKLQTRGVAKAKRLEFPVILTIAQEDVPTKYRHIQYQVWGKTITTKKIDWVADITEPYRNKVHVLVDAEKCSQHLKLNKGSFKRGQGPVSDMYKSVERWVHGTLRKHGYVETQTGQVQHSAQLSRFFKKLFKNPEYEWLNPNAAKGMGPGKGTKTKAVEDAQNNSSESTDRKQQDGKNKKRGEGGLRIILLDKEGDPRDGWLDPETNNFVCNKQHPLYRKYADNGDARNQRVKSIIFSELIKYGARQRMLTTEEAFNIHRDLMTQAKDLKVPGVAST